MPTNKTLDTLRATLDGLRAEHSTLGDAVHNLEELLTALTRVGKNRSARDIASMAAPRRRGRPPGSGKKKARRGRPPKSAATRSKSSAGKARGRKAGHRGWSEEQRQAVSERMKAYWAERKQD